MTINEFVKTLDSNKVYYVRFHTRDWGIIFNKLIFWDDGSYLPLNQCNSLCEEDMIYDGTVNNSFDFCNKNNQIYPHNPMPELKVGMFIECNTANGKSLGVVINNNRTVFQNGVWASGINNDWYADHITKVFSDEATCFDTCHDAYIIWRRD